MINNPCKTCIVQACCVKECNTFKLFMHHREMLIVFIDIIICIILIISLYLTDIKYIFIICISFHIIFNLIMNIVQGKN